MLGQLGLCFYVPVRPINDYLPPICPSYQCISTVLLTSFFISANDILLSIIPSANASFRLQIKILISVAGIVGVVFCLLLVPSILLMCTFHMLCQLTLSDNATFFQCFLPLIDFCIDICDSWDYVHSVIAPIRPYTPPPPPLLLMSLYLLYAPPIKVSILYPIDKSTFISIIPYINYFSVDGNKY